MSQPEYWIDAGFNAATRAHLTKAGSIVGYVQAIDQSTPDGLNLAGGVFKRAIQICGMWLEGGGTLAIPSGIPTIDRAVDGLTLQVAVNAILTKPDQTGLSIAFGAIVTQADALIRDGLARFIVDEPKVTPEPVMQATLPPTINITNEIHPANIREVAIVAMPSRETTTELTRDRSGGIVETRQREVDAP